MGCASSRAEHSPVVSLCRDRVTLIRDVTKLRYSLAAAHSAYFHSLSSLGDALLNFAVQQSNLAGAATLASSSPTISLPPPTKSKSVNLSTSTSSSSITTIPSDEDYGAGGGGDSHIHISRDSDTAAGGKSKSENTTSSATASYMKSTPTIGSTVYASATAGTQRLGKYYMRSSAGVPYTIYEDPYGQNWYNYPPYGVPVEPFERPAPPPPAPRTPPPPPPAGGSGWDFLNPFDSYEQYMQGYINENYRMHPSETAASSPSSSPSSNEVREREGIPPLEEETETEFDQRSNKRKVKKKISELEESLKPGGSSSSSNNSSSEGKGESNGKSRSQSSSSEMIKRKGNVEENSLKSKAVSFEEISNSTKESNGAEMSVHSSKAKEGAHLGSRDAVDAVEEIKERFKLTAEIGHEVAKVLEVGKLPFRSRMRAFRVISSRIFDPVAYSLSACSRASLKRARHAKSRSRHSRHSKYRNMDSSKYTYIKNGSLSSTLEKLYVWEKKLFKEIKDEEKLRIIYEDKCRRLKDLDGKGAEPHEIDSMRASIRHLQAKLTIAIKSVDAISKRMHRVRDEELQPKLVELIQRTTGMWKSMLDCHQNQLKAIMGSKSLHLVAKTEFGNTFVAKATIELELELLNWCYCFTKWISYQRDYMKAFNGWLIKWLPQEQEITPDGVAPFSPSRIGAPSAFVISNDWYNAIERVSEKDVMEAIQKFAVNVHRLWERQVDRQHEQSKAEYISRDFTRRLKSLQKEFNVNEYLEIVSVSESHQLDLDSLKQSLDEEKAKQEEIISQGSLRGGLIPIFKALENFASETLKSYEDVRIPTQDQGAKGPT